MLEWTAGLPMTSAYFELLFREFGGTAQAEAALREGTGVRSLDGEVTLGQQLVQISNINRLEPPGWGLRFGDRIETAANGPLGFAVGTCFEATYSTAGVTKNDATRFEDRAD